jgi:hypothetical protein
MGPVFGPAAGVFLNAHFALAEHGGVNAFG